MRGAALSVAERMRVALLTLRRRSSADVTRTARNNSKNQAHEGGLHDGRSDDCDRARLLRLLTPMPLQMVEDESWSLTIPSRRLLPSACWFTWSTRCCGPSGSDRSYRSSRTQPPSLGGQVRPSGCIWPVLAIASHIRRWSGEPLCWSRIRCSTLVRHGNEALSSESQLAIAREQRQQTNGGELLPRRLHPSREP
jgi:hypothetical protein